MNEFVAKKLGEVLAFSQLGVELFERGEEALRTLFTDYDQIIDSFKTQANEIEQVVNKAGVGEVTETKAQKTGDKLRGMMETYIGDEWHNSAELLEWMGFFEGAAVVHWRLVEGAAAELNDKELLSLAERSTEYRHDLFHRVQDAIKAIGASKART